MHQQKTARVAMPKGGKPAKVTKKVWTLLSSYSSSRDPVADRRSAPQFIINASQPASDKIFDVSAFEKFLHDKIKVDNRVGNLGDAVQISQQGDGKIEVIAHIEFSGRYLKYL